MRNAHKHKSRERTRGLAKKDMRQLRGSSRTELVDGKLRVAYVLRDVDIVSLFVHRMKKRLGL